LAKKEISSKKQLDAEIAQAKEEKKQSRNLKSLGDLKGKTFPTPSPSETPKTLASSQVLPPQLPKKDLAMLQKQLKETKKSVAVMLTATISLDLVGLEMEPKAKKEIVIPEAIVSLECQGMTSLIRLPADGVRTILNALGLQV
jgi:hypothetical protein